MFNAENGSNLVFCPYNPEHRVMRKRLQSHLIKCRKNYPDVELQKCPFNVTHLVPESEFVQHKTTCPDGKLVAHYKYGPQDPKKEPKEMKPLKHEAFEKDENWEI